MLTLPGEFAFTRRVHPTMYRGRFWTLRQCARFDTTKEANKRYCVTIAVGTALGSRPPHRSERALLTRSALALLSKRVFATSTAHATAFFTLRNTATFMTWQRISFGSGHSQSGFC
jgi:hypothetical protein